MKSAWVRNDKRESAFDRTNGEDDHPWDDRLRHSSDRMLILSYHCAPRRISFPITTPDAADITTGPSAISCARATPCLIGASTVLVSFPSLAVNVTTVPSGTGLPAQSRTGSVSTTTPFAVR